MLLLDDLLATGGTALAAAKLVEKCDAIVQNIGFVINLPELPGEQAIKDAGYQSFHLIEFSGH